MAYDSNINPGNPPIVWSRIKEAFDKINEKLTHTGTFGGSFEGNNYAGNHKYIRVNKISLFIKFNKPAHDILFPCMAVIVCMNSYCPSPRMHIHISSTT